MKILITTDWYSPTINGVVTSVKSLKKELTALGHDVRILTLKQGNNNEKYDKVWYIPSFSVGKIYPDARMLKSVGIRQINEIIKWKPDIIHSQCEFSTFIFAKRISKKLNIPIIHTYHTIYEDYTHYFSPSKTFGGKMVKKFTNSTIKHVKSVVAPTGKVKNILMKYCVNKPINIIPTGINISEYSKKYEKRLITQKKEELHISPEKKILLYLGRVAKEKNIEELIYFMNMRSGKHLVLLIVGDGPYMYEMKNKVEELGMIDKVFFTGMVDPDKVDFYYKMADVFVSASTSETQGITYLEALSNGLPCVCKKDPCIDEIIIDNKNGFQYKNHDEFWQIIDKILYNDELKKELSKEAIKIAKKYSESEMVKRLESLYMEHIA